MSATGMYYHYRLLLQKNNYCRMSRRGYWFLPRCIAGVPLGLSPSFLSFHLSLTLLTVEFVRPWFPVVFQRLITRLILWVSVGPNEKYGLPRKLDSKFVF